MSEEENRSSDNSSQIKEQIKQALLKEYPVDSSLFSDQILEQILLQVHQGVFKDVRVGRDLIVEGKIIQKIVLNIILPSPPVPSKICHNLPLSGIKQFVGRYSSIIKLHEKLQQQSSIVITAIAGMGGVGKTELALQYALQYQDEYPGSICWFKVRDQDLGSQIIEFAGTRFNLYPQEQLKSDSAKVEYCWSRWAEENSLIILDDVPNYGEDYRKRIQPYLPPNDSRFKVLMTSRQHPGTSMQKIDLDALSPEAALGLMTTLIGKSRIEAELEVAKALCKWLGYLPLGLELVGRYLEIDQNFSLAEVLDNLKAQKLEAEELLEPEEADMTAQLGVASAFELSWKELSEETQRLGCYLSLFTPELFDWSWVENALINNTDDEQFKVTKRDLIKQKRELLKLNLLQMFSKAQSSTEYNYQLHSLIQKYFRAKLETLEQKELLKQKFTLPMIAIAQSIPRNPTLEDITRVTLAIPHLSNVATELIDYVEDENLIWAFEGLGRFYEGQGIYNQAEQWRQKILQTRRTRLGQEHHDVAVSLNSLATLYLSQGRYEEAEPRFLESLEITQKLLGEEHPSVATSLNNLAALYKSQGRYEEAEPRFLEALELRRKLLGQEHPDVANSLNHLAELYRSQGRYDEAESLSLEALDLHRKLLGEEHPDVATNLSNLALVYKSQGRYEEAEPRYLEALELYRKLLGQEHPYVASSLNSLAELYRSQGRYEEAEPLYLEALELRRKLLGQEHPDVATSLDNLALLYKSQGRYEEAESLYQQALAIAEVALGENHPNTHTIRENFLNAVMMKLLQLPESELKQLVPPEVFEQLLQIKQQLQ